MPEPYQISLGLYNSAGELVRVIFKGHAQYAPGSIPTSSDTLAEGAQSLGILFNGGLEGVSNGPQSSLAWDGRNANGQFVSGGVYYLKLDEIDPYGNLNSLVKSISVIAAAWQQSLTVYNSAGEAVAHLPVAMGPGARMAVQESSKALVLDPVTGLPTSGFNIQLSAPGAPPSTVVWKGLNDAGAVVAPGTYTLVLATSDPGQTVTRDVKTVVVLTAPGGLGLGAVHAVPQPLGKGPLTVVFNPLPAGDTVWARVFNLAGERVLQGRADAATGRVELGSAPGLASGIYIISVDWMHGAGLRERRLAKLAVTK